MDKKCRVRRDDLTNMHYYLSEFKVRISNMNLATMKGYFFAVILQEKY